MNSELFIPSNLIKVINAFYTKYIERIKSKKARNEELTLTYTGLEIFLKFLPESFKKDFLSLIPSEILTNKAQSIKKLKTNNNQSTVNKLVTAYCQDLHKKRGLKLFIGKDAYSLYKRYKTLYENQNDCAYLPYSRLSLFRVNNGNGYFKLVDLYYEVFLKSKNLKDFIKNFKIGLRSKVKFYLQIEIKTLKVIGKYKLYEVFKQYNKIHIVDSGTQGGLIFPLYTVLENEGFHCDFSLFACFNWAYPMIKSRTFTNDLYTFLQVEEDGMKEYYHDFPKTKN